MGKTNQCQAHANDSNNNSSVNRKTFYARRPSSADVDDDDDVENDDDVFDIDPIRYSFGESRKIGWEQTIQTSISLEEELRCAGGIRG